MRIVTNEALAELIVYRLVINSYFHKRVFFFSSALILLAVTVLGKSNNVFGGFGQQTLSYKDCSGCHDGVYRERFDQKRNPECFGCHNPGKTIFIDKFINKTQTKTSNLKNKAPLGSEVFVPAGYFKMGSDDRMPDEAPEHKVYVKPFWIDKYEVTNKQYETFILSTGHVIPRNWTTGTYPPNKGSHPVTYVSWYDAAEYCEWADKRLPTEAEWEKAARGTDGRDFPWGDDLDPDKANMPQSEIKDTTPVGSYESGKSPYGLYDMGGNVYEWVQEWYYLYEGSPSKKTDLKNFSGNKNKILKGGSWYDCLTYVCGFSVFTYNRAFLGPEVKNNSAGFRCARDYNNADYDRIEKEIILD